MLLGLCVYEKKCTIASLLKQNTIYSHLLVQRTEFIDVA